MQALPENMNHLWSALLMEELPRFLDDMLASHAFYQQRKKIWA